MKRNATRISRSGHCIVLSWSFCVGVSVCVWLGVVLPSDPSPPELRNTSLIPICLVHRVQSSGQDLIPCSGSHLLTSGTCIAEMSRNQNDGGWPQSPRNGAKNYQRSASPRARSSSPGRRNSGRAIFIGNLSSTAHYDDVKHLFSPYSEVNSIGILYYSWIYYPVFY